MNITIKAIADNQKIKEKKEKKDEMLKQIYLNERKMSKLTFDRNIGLYAYYMDEYLCLLSKLETYEREKVLNKLKEITLKLDKLKDYPGVQEYNNLRLQNLMFKFKISDYYKTVQKDFRFMISLLPSNVYVKEEENIKHIVNSNKVKRKEDGDIVISSQYDINSKRDLRHFYNKVSFKYLESLSEDYSFDLEGKNLGKIKRLK